MYNRLEIYYKGKYKLYSLGVGSRKMDRVRIIQDPKVIKLLADPVRRELLRLISIQPLTETQLSERLNLKKSSTGYHLQVLREAGLVKIWRTRVGAYGILEKFYKPTADIFIIDWDKVPSSLKRYFLYNHLERLRGMLSTLQLMAEERGREIQINSDELMELAEEVAKTIPEVGRKYQNVEGDMDREMLIIRIYSETLERVLSKEKWRKLIEMVKEAYQIKLEATIND